MKHVRTAIEQPSDARRLIGYMRRAVASLHRVGADTMPGDAYLFDAMPGDLGCALPHHTLPTDSLRLTIHERRPLIAFLRTLTDTVRSP